MKIVEINSYDFGSTGRIMLDIAEIARNCGYQVFTFSSKIKGTSCLSFVDHIYIDNHFGTIPHKYFGMLFGFENIFSYVSTKRLINYIKDIEPDIIHLHNLHGYYLNIEMLFNFFKKYKAKYIWTLHDCWSFTGRCPHFTMVNCNKWLNECNNCLFPKDSYPSSYLYDNSRYNYNLKKKLFSGFENMTIVTPSLWLSHLVKKSFLSEYNTIVINNGINLEIFKPTIDYSVYEKYNIDINKTIILCVAYSFNSRKGIDVIINIANHLPQDYIIVMVGNYEDGFSLPNNIVHIPRTNNVYDLVALYSISSVFFNPTREDNYPTVNMESLACGCPVITFNTGGSPEIIDEYSGRIVEEDNFEDIIYNIIDICENNTISRYYCTSRSKLFDINMKYQQYIEYYDSLFINKNIQYYR